MVFTGRIIFEEERKAMAKLVHLIYNRKLTNTAGGNFSFMVHDEDGKQLMIMTPTMMSEAYLGELTPNQILVVDPKTREIVAGEGKLTREINMHEAIYETNPDITAIIHAHAPEALFWSTSNLPIPNVTEVTQLVGKVYELPFAPATSQPLADTVRKFMEEKKPNIPFQVNLNSHGVLIATKGPDGITAVHSALAILDTMETNAKVAYQQTVMQGLGIMDGYYSNGRKIGTLEDLKNGVEIHGIDEH